MASQGNQGKNDLMKDQKANENHDIKLFFEQLSGTFQLPGHISEIYKDHMSKIMNEEANTRQAIIRWVKYFFETYLQGRPYSATRGMEEVKLGLKKTGQVYYAMFWLELGRLMSSKCHEKLREINVCEAIITEFNKKEGKPSDMQKLGFETADLGFDAYKILSTKLRRLQKHCSQLKNDEELADQIQRSESSGNEDDEEGQIQEGFQSQMIYRSDPKRSSKRKLVNEKLNLNMNKRMKKMNNKEGGTTSPYGKLTPKRYPRKDDSDTSDEDNDGFSVENKSNLSGHFESLFNG